MNKQIGKLSKQVISLLDLSYQEGQPIILGEANMNICKDFIYHDGKKDKYILKKWICKKT